MNLQTHQLQLPLIEFAEQMLWLDLKLVPTPDSSLIFKVIEYGIVQAQ
ncbi:MAG: hypothetical protein SVR94_03920 [Pseudomonadota bacterium]|nr:hypothetical protein [Pseudomonadota bacterium]